MDFRMLLSSHSLLKHVEVFFESILDDWKVSPELYPNKFSFPSPSPALPVDPLAVPSPPPSPSPPPPLSLLHFHVFSVIVCVCQLASFLATSQLGIKSFTQFKST